MFGDTKLAHNKVSGIFLVTLCVCVGRGAVAMVSRLTVLLLLCGSVLLRCVFVLVAVRLLWCGG